MLTPVLAVTVNSRCKNTVHPGLTPHVHTHANKVSRTHLIPSTSSVHSVGVTIYYTIFVVVCHMLVQHHRHETLYGYGESTNVAMNPVGRSVRADIDGHFFTSRCILAYLLSLPFDI